MICPFYPKIAISSYILLGHTIATTGKKKVRKGQKRRTENEEQEEVLLLYNTTHPPPTWGQLRLTSMEYVSSATVQSWHLPEENVP